MKTKKYLFLLPLMALVLGGCDNTEETPDSGTTEPDPEEPTVEITVESVLNKLWETPIAFKGEYDVSGVSKETGVAVDEYTYQVEGYIGTDSYFNITTNEDGVENSRFEYYANVDTGYTETRYLDPTTNQTVCETVLDYTMNYEPFLFSSVFYNPWYLVDASMGTVEDNVVTFDLTTTAGGYMFYMFTAFSGIYAQEVTVTVDASTGDIESVSFYEVADGYFYTVECTYTRSFTYQYVTLDEVDYYNVESRSGDEGTAALQNIFNSLKEGNYTVSVDVTTSGAYISDSTESIKIYSTPTMLLEETNGTIVGYVDDDTSGYREVTGTAGDTELTASAYTREGSVSDLLVPFTILAEMFDYDGDDTYLYANRGTEDFLYLTMPENLYTAYQQYTPMVDTYTWKLNNDGSATINYYVFNDEVITLSVKATVYNIGSTDLSGYTVTVPGSSDSSGSWENVEGAVALLAAYDIPYEIFPWFDGLTGSWYIEDYEWAGYMETTNTIGDDVETVLKSTLEAAGWVYTTTQYSELYFEYDLDGTTLNVSFYTTASYVMFFIYPSS